MTLGFSTDEIRSPIRGYGVENVDVKVSSSLLDIPIVSTEKHSTSCSICYQAFLNWLHKAL